MLAIGHISRPTLMIRTWHRILILLICVLVAYILVVEVMSRGLAAITVSWERRSLEDRVRVGMSKAEVIRHLGQPRYVARVTGELNPGPYKPIPRYRVEKEVLVYSNMVWKLYVYINTKERVSQIAMART